MHAGVDLDFCEGGGGGGGGGGELACMSILHFTTGQCSSKQIANTVMND